MLHAVDLKTGNSVPYIPLPAQAAFHASPAKYRAFIAGLGNGKSQCAIMELIRAALLYPGSYNAIVRWDQTSLRDTTWLLLTQTLKVSNLYDSLVVREINSAQQSMIEFINGSVIRGFHAKSWKRFGGLGLSSFFMDEASECPNSEAYDQLCARLDRHPVGPRRGWIVGLPDAHNWIWHRFYEKKLKDHELFRGTSFDNPYLTSDYAQRMVELYGKERSMVMVMGSFDTIEGRLLDLFDDVTHVIPRRPFPSDWPRYVAIDPGYSPDPCAMVRVVVDPHGNIIVEHEFEKEKLTTERWSAEILALNQNPPPMWYSMDRSAFSMRGDSPVSVADTARHCGISPLREAGNTAGYIDQSIARLRSLLTPMEGNFHPITGQQGTYPRFWVVSDCARTIWEIKNLTMRKAGALSAMTGIKLPDHHHDLVDCIFWLALDHLTPASSNHKPVLSDLWKQILGPDQDRRPYLEQVSRMRVGDRQQRRWQHTSSPGNPIRGFDD